MLVSWAEDLAEEEEAVRWIEHLIEAERNRVFEFVL